MRQEKPKSPVYPLAEVTVAVLTFYVLTGLLTARGLAHWASHLPDSRVALSLRQATERFWAGAATLGLEAPEDRLERTFLRARGARSSELPVRYADAQSHRRERRAREAAGEPPPWPHAVVEATSPDDDDAPEKGPRVLVLGDSIMMKVGPAIRHDVESRLGGAAVVNAQLSTGLARPDVYDWVKELRRAVQGQRYDDIIMMLGTNDSQDFVDGGRLLAYGTTEWVQAYNRRLASLMDVACQGTDHGLWIGLPPMRDARFERKAERINAWAQRQVARHACMSYVPLDDVLGDERGRFASYLRIDDRLEKVRTLDGIHVTAQGGSLVSEALLTRLTQAGAAATSH